MRSADGKCVTNVLDSRDGTSVNGYRIKPGLEVQMKPGDLVRLAVLGQHVGHSRVIGGWPPSAVCRRRVL